MSQRGLTARNAWPTPTSVPPVPTPSTIASGTIPAGSWARISGPSHSRVLVDVPFVVELLGREEARPGADLAGALEGFDHVEVADFEDLRSERPRDRHALRAHPVGHDDEHPVALHGGHHAHRIAGVAAARLDDRVARMEQPLAFGSLDHVLRDARLDRARRVEELELDPDAVDPDQRGMADRVEDGGSRGILLRLGAHQPVQEECHHPCLEEEGADGGILKPWDAWPS